MRQPVSIAFVVALTIGVLVALLFPGCGDPKRPASDRPPAHHLANGGIRFGKSAGTETAGRQKSSANLPTTPKVHTRKESAKVAGVGESIERKTAPTEKIGTRKSVMANLPEPIGTRKRFGKIARTLTRAVDNHYQRSEALSIAQDRPAITYGWNHSPTVPRSTAGI